MEDPEFSFCDVKTMDGVIFLNHWINCTAQNGITYTISYLFSLNRSFDMSQLSLTQ